MTRKKPGIAIIGLGPAAQPHARSFVDLASRATVVWAASRTRERTDSFTKKFPFPVTNDVNAAIADAAVDIVLVLTPPNTHLEIAQAAFAAGKDVLLEKPLDTTVERSERLVRLARESGLTFGVVLQHRFRPASLRLRELLRTDALGIVEAASLAVPWWRPQSYYDEAGRGSLARDGGGVLLSQAIHAIDLFRSLLGPIKAMASLVTTTGLHRMETEDHVAALLTLGNGAPASLTATTAAYPGAPESLTVIGTAGTARLTGGALKASFVDGREESVEAEGKSGSGAAIMDFAHDAHRALINDFLDAVEQRRDPAITGEEALATQRLIADIIRADPRCTQLV